MRRQGLRGFEVIWQQPSLLAVLVTRRLEAAGKVVPVPQAVQVKKIVPAPSTPVPELIRQAPVSMAWTVSDEHRFSTSTDGWDYASQAPLTVRLHQSCEQ